MDQKLVKVYEEPREYINAKGRKIHAVVRSYEFECIDCGDHYMRNKYSSRGTPYCGQCWRKHNAIKALAKKHEKAESIKERMCDEYCKMPREAADQEELEELCKYCPLNELSGGG